ncbi:MAG: TRAP transporter small permease subunit [Gemmatimonas sp.]|nr:TRAP transporter small permease subunit [Gemmatimonas sp.]
MPPHRPPRGANNRDGTWFDTAAERLDRWSERVSFELFRFGIYVTMPALVVLVSLDVTLRYFFNAPLQWARDVNGLLLLVTIFCALPHAWDRAYHIRMEVFYSRFSPETRRRADVLASLAGLIFFGLMAFQGARFVPFMIRTGETGEDLELPLWPFMMVLSICALVVAARIFSNPEGTEGRLRYPSASEAGDSLESEVVRVTPETGVGPSELGAEAGSAGDRSPADLEEGSRA